MVVRSVSAFLLSYKKAYVEFVPESTSITFNHSRVEFKHPELPQFSYLGEYQVIYQNLR